jgi:hypothetical protein
VSAADRLSEQDLRELARLMRVIHRRSEARREREQQEQAADHDAA